MGFTSNEDSKSSESAKTTTTSFDPNNFTFPTSALASTASSTPFSFDDESGEIPQRGYGSSKFQPLVSLSEEDELAILVESNNTEEIKKKFTKDNVNFKRKNTQPLHYAAHKGKSNTKDP